MGAVNILKFVNVIFSFSCAFSDMCVLTRMKRVSWYDDKRISEDIAWSSTDMSLGQCALECYQDPLCLSVQYEATTGECTALSDKYDGLVVPVIAFPGVILYETDKDKITTLAPPASTTTTTTTPLTTTTTTTTTTTPTTTTTLTDTTTITTTTVTTDTTTTTVTTDTTTTTVTTDTTTTTVTTDTTTTATTTTVALTSTTTSATTTTPVTTATTTTTTMTSTTTATTTSSTTTTTTTTSSTTTTTSSTTSSTTSATTTTSSTTTTTTTTTTPGCVSCIEASCNDGVCSCPVGYSLFDSECRPLSECTTFSDVFEKFEGHSIFMTYYKSSIFSSRSNCKDDCINDSPRCKSVDFDSLLKVCFRQDVHWLDEPGARDDNSGAVDRYERQCATWGS